MLILLGWDIDMKNKKIDFWSIGLGIFLVTVMLPLLGIFVYQTCLVMADVIYYVSRGNIKAFMVLIIMNGFILSFLFMAIDIFKK